MRWQFIRTKAQGASFKALFCLILSTVLALHASLSEAQSRSLQRDDAGRWLIPEVIKLEEGEAISSRVYENYNSRIIGQSLVARLTENREPPKRLTQLTKRLQRQMEESPAFNGGYFGLEIPMEDREIHIYRTTKHLRQIIENGLLNFHQTGTSSFDSESERRLKAEDKFAELKISGDAKSEELLEKANALRPKYGVLEITTPLFFGSVANAANGQLGPVTVVLKKEVLKRSTYTYDDSLLMYDGEDRTLTKTQLRRRLRPLSDPILYLQTPTNYFEAQIWGEIDLRDVQEWRVSSSVKAKDIALLKKSGLPIYRDASLTFTDADLGRNSRVRGKLLYAGDPKKIKFFARELAKVDPPEESKILPKDCAFTLGSL